MHSIEKEKEHLINRITAAATELLEGKSARNTEMFEKLCSLDSTKVIAHSTLAQAYAIYGNPEKSKQHYQALLKCPVLKEIPKTQNALVIQKLRAIDCIYGEDKAGKEKELRNIIDEIGYKHSAIISVLDYAISNW